MATANINLGSGASWSFIGLVRYVKEAGFNPVVVVQEEGGIYDELSKEHLTIYVVKQPMHNWIESCNMYRSKLHRRILRKIKYGIVNKISEIQVKKIIKKEKIELVHMNSLTELEERN